MSTIASVKLGRKTLAIIGYIRVSTDEQVRNGASLEAQRAAIACACEQHGWPAAAVIEDAGLSGKDLKRPGVQAAFGLLGKGDVLVVTKLDRLTRRMRDLTDVIETAGRKGWALVTLEGDIDMTTAQGEAFAHMLGVFAHLERRLIGERTREALAVKKANGVRLGRPPSLPTAVRDRIAGERMAGRTLAAIADALNAEGVPTAQGGLRWWPSTVRAVVRPS